MSAEKCPFCLNSSNPDDTNMEDLYAPFEGRFDPANANSTTTTHNVRKLDSNDVERVLMYVQAFNDIVEKANVPVGLQRWTLFESMLLGPSKTKRITHRNGYRRGNLSYGMIVNNFVGRGYVRTMIERRI
eukprot:13253938-Ditylum_brightwellii.AAC.1